MMDTVLESQAGETTLATEKRKRHFGPRMIFCIIIIMMGSLSYSYSAGVISTTIGQPSFYEYMGLNNSPHATALLGACSSLYYAGGVFGSFFSNFVGDRWGRKISIYTGAIIVLVSAALCAGSVNIAMFIVFRFISGFGGFMLLMSVPLWIIEVVPPEVRGAFAQCHSVAVSTGYLISSYVGVGFFLDLPVNSISVWRGPQAIGALPPIILLLGLWWVPESPRYLLMKGHVDKAREIVRSLHSAHGDTEHRFAEIELFQMTRQIELDRTLPSSWLYIFRRPSFRKRMWMTVFIGFAVLSSGNLSISIYATVMLSNLGFDSTKQLLIQSGFFVAVLPGLFTSIFFTDHLRRPSMVGGGLFVLAVVLSCYTAVTASFLDVASNKPAQIAGVALIYIFEVFSAALVEGPLAYWAAEFYPTHLRAKGATLQTVTYACVSIMWSQSGSTAIANLGWKFFLIFICITIVTGNIIFWFFPNTQGKSLEEVALLFGDDDLVVLLQEDIRIDASHNITGKLLLDGEGKIIVENLEDIQQT
jgi:sugar porter (SP) family MFS transporter